MLMCNCADRLVGTDLLRHSLNTSDSSVHLHMGTQSDSDLADAVRPPGTRKGHSEEPIHVPVRIPGAVIARHAAQSVGARAPGAADGLPPRPAGAGCAAPRSGRTAEAAQSWR